MESAGKTAARYEVKAYRFVVRANENWHPRWDGQDQEIDGAASLARGDREKVMRDIASDMRHPSYIRVRGKPLL